MAKVDRKSVRVELSEDTVSRLLAGGQLCAADLNCLDCRSKECLLKIVLKACRGDFSRGQALAEN